MSMPTFPEHGIDLTKEQAFHMLLGSIAMEELALSHIMNAEGEKLQYLLGTLPNSSCHCATPQELLEVNRSVTQVLEHVNQSQLLLKGKLDQVLRAMECYVPCEQKPCPAQNGPTPCSLCHCSFVPSKRYTWRKGGRLNWKKESCTGDMCCWQAETPACFYLPTGKKVLLHYTLLLSAPEAGTVSVSIQRLQNGTTEDVEICETSVLIPDAPVQISGSVCVSGQQGCIHPAKLCFILREPAAVTVKQGSLCLMVLP